MGRLVFRSPRAGARLERARAWLAAKTRGEELLILAPTLEAAGSLARGIASANGAAFGWHRLTLTRLAAVLAGPRLAERNLAPVGPLPLEALAKRVVHALAETERLGRFAAVASFPGLPRAIARTLLELRLEGVGPALLRERFREFVDLHQGYEEELARARLADRALVLRVAAEVVRALEVIAVAPRPVAGPGDALPSAQLQLGFDFAPPRGAVVTHATPVARSGTALALLGKPLLALDVPLGCALERDLFGAIVAQAPDALVTVPEGDDRTLGFVASAIGERAVEEVDSNPASAGAPALVRLQHHLFAASAAPIGALDESVTILSAPGESREAVEIARRIQAEAERGVPFDRMAILLRAPNAYRAHLEEALRRARVPAWFARGSVRPDPSGRAFLALVSCAIEKLSARRFAEYLSLGQVPDADASGAPPAATADGDRPVAPDEEMTRPLVTIEPRDEPEDEPLPAEDNPPVAGGTLRAPRRWERLLVDASVIGGIDRWKRRLGGLAKELADAAVEAGENETIAFAKKRDLADLEALQGFALPLLEELAALDGADTWGGWIDRLGALATRSLKTPERVLGVLAELAPMANVGPVELADVALALGRRLTELVVLPAARRSGRVFVAPIDAARGLAFEVVFVPGLAERIFPQKVIEDPILRDTDRLELGLETNKGRAIAERLALRVAVGAAEGRVVLSYPRVDLDQSRPRVPSFYGLELLRAAEGALPGFDELARRAEKGGGAARIGWPAPPSPALAIDEAEYDLALLDELFRKDQKDTVGAAHYLLLSNDHLARALRFRARRWNVRKWTGADGLVELHPDAKAALANHALSARSFSPTALQNFSACPYRFVLHTMHRLSPREVPEAIEELDPLDKGSLVHEVLYRFVTELRQAGLLPFDASRSKDVHERLERVVDEAAHRYADRLAPAIARVWEDGIQTIKADLREWLRRAIEDASWSPHFLELSFGPVPKGEGRDAASSDAPVLLDCGIQLRGSIDLVEKNTADNLRATDYKTGKKRAEPGTIIAGGQTLQPVLYALVLEKLFPGVVVEGGRLYYATSTGGFEGVEIPLDDRARDGAAALARALQNALEKGFFPAAPAEGACMWCDFKQVCGPYEEQRAKKKITEPLGPLIELRKIP